MTHSNSGSSTDRMRIYDRIEQIHVEAAERRIIEWHRQRACESRDIAWLAASRDLASVSVIAQIDAETHDNSADRIERREHVE
jgi:hypothetical protein